MSLPHHESGRTLTLLELALALFLIAAATLVAFPLWQSEKLRTNEQDAVAMLRRIGADQAVLHRANAGKSYAWMDELAGIDCGRSLTKTPEPTFGKLVPEAAIIKSGGYFFTAYLADAKGRASRFPEYEKNFAPIPDFFVAYAWPVNAGRTGRIVYALLADGSIYAAENPTPPFEGRTSIPHATTLGPALKGTPLDEAATSHGTLRWNQLPAGASR